MTVIKIGPNEIGKELAARAAGTPGEIAKAMTHSALRGQATLVRRTPKDLGGAKAGWRTTEVIKRAKKIHVDLYNDAPYVGILEEGARPHKVSVEGIIAIYEWVLRNIPTPAHGPIQAYSRKTKSGGKKDFLRKTAEASDEAAMDIAVGIIRKLNTKGQEGKFFVAKSMDELGRSFELAMKKQIAEYARRRLTRGGSK